MKNSDLRLECTPDVLIANQVLYLGSRSELEGLHLGCAVWLGRGGPVHDLHCDSLGHAISIIRSSAVTPVLWLLVGNTSPQPDNRATRYRMLWNSLRARGLRLPKAATSHETLVKVEDELRFFGALKLDESASAEEIVSLLEAEPISSLVMLREGQADVIESLVENGWDRPLFGASGRTIEMVCGHAGLVLWLVGGFDDIEAGTAMIGSPGVIEEIVDSR